MLNEKNNNNHISYFHYLIATYCKGDIISLDEERDIKAPDKVQIITLDEKNRVVYLNFVFANIDQLDDYVGKELTMLGFSVN